MCVNASRWDCTLERIDNTDRLAVRLGLRQVKGLGNTDAAAIVAARADRAFASVDYLWRRAGWRSRSRTIRHSCGRPRRGGSSAAVAEFRGGQPSVPSRRAPAATWSATLSPHALKGSGRTPPLGVDGTDEQYSGLQRLALVLNELLANTREMFLLNRGDGLTYTQIAARYGIGVTAVERHIVRALNHLRLRLSRDN